MAFLASAISVWYHIKANWIYNHLTAKEHVKNITVIHFLPSIPLTEILSYISLFSSSSLFLFTTTLYTAQMELSKCNKNATQKSIIIKNIFPHSLHLTHFAMHIKVKRICGGGGLGKNNGRKKIISSHINKFFSSFSFFWISKVQWEEERMREKIIFNNLKLQSR